jgi:CubicO group peptidase (beta-lactamase class C family)/catechol 2,3-dioxygenase-like lactoylglutathione lyase family enzyme
MRIGVTGFLHMACIASIFMAGNVASAQGQAPVGVPAPIFTDPATVVPGSKAVARRTTLVVSDLERSKRFYEALGFHEDRRSEVSDSASLKVFGLPDGTHLTFIRMTNDNTLSTGRIDGGTLGLAQVHDRRLARLRDRTRGATLLGTTLLIMTTDGLDAVHARLQAFGAEILEAPMAMSGGFRTLVVRDPDGTRLEITQPPTAAPPAPATATAATPAAAPTPPPAAPAFPDARASDPVTLGWMVGSPPPADRTIAFDDGSYYRFPQLRWSFSHWRELTPTVNVPRGTRPAQPLPRALRTDLDALTFTPLGATRPMTWEQSLAANYTDGIVVLHKGRIVYERYFGALQPDAPHIAFSVTKSFFGTIAAMLVDAGRLDPDALVSRYLPELKDSAFGDATVRQVLDMTTALKFSEKYADPKAEIWNFARASGQFPLPPGYQGPRSLYEYLPTLVKEGEHGKGFAYRSPNAEVLVWLIRRVTGKSAAQNLQELIWEKLGAEQDAFIQVDPRGNAVGAGGLNLGLRDLARFGEMMRLDGAYGGRQIVPARVVAEIRRGGNREQFASGGYTTLPGWSYHDQWWIAHDGHGTFAARGVHGQAIYIDPQAQLVIARFGSHPLASNSFLDPTSIPAYRAMADYLIAND